MLADAAASPSSIATNSYPISALEHLLYCPRQCALIHVEGLWHDNAYTVQGQLLHERADSGRSSKERQRPVWRRVALASEALGIHGYADTLEMHGTAAKPEWVLVEYKRGPRRRHVHDEVQLCAQALCLEEMTQGALQRGFIYHCASKRRREVHFDAALRARTRRACAELHAMMAARETPPPLSADDPRCRHCSLRDGCLPERPRGELSAFWQGACDDDALS